MIPMVTTPAMTSGVWKNRRACQMTKPSPEFAATISAMMR